MRFLKTNPEIQKYVWTELTPNRITAVSILLGALFIVGAIGADSGNAANIVNKTALIVWFVLSVLWGSKLAADAIIEEVNNQTWDWQRMACQSAQNIILGKLFGSALTAWYGSFICMIVYFVTALYLPDFSTNLLIGINTLLYGILSNAAALLITLFGLHRMPVRSKLKANFYLLFILAPAISYFVLILFKAKDALPISWYIYNFNIFESYFISLIFLVFWALVGLVRQARREFFYQNGIRIWLAFLLSSIVFFSGFIYPKFEGKPLVFVAISLLISAATILAISYCLLFSERKDLAILRQIYQHLRSKSYTKIGYITPLWLFSLLFAFVLGIVGMGLFCLSEAAQKDGLIITVAVCSIIFFALRDFGFSLLMHIRVSDRKNDKLSAIYIVCAYGLPIWFFAYGNGNPDSGNQILPSLFFPILSKQTHLYYILPPLIEAIIVWYLFIKSKGLVLPLQSANINQANQK